MIHVPKNYIFSYIVSEKIEELIQIYIERGFKKRKIHDILLDSSIIFESLYYNKDSENNHEDLIDCGYVLGCVHAKEGGSIIAINLDSFRYYFVGSEDELFFYIKDRIRKI